MFNSIFVVLELTGKHTAIIFITFLSIFPPFCCKEYFASPSEEIEREIEREREREIER